MPKSLRIKPTTTYIYRFRGSPKIKGVVVAEDVADLYRQIERNYFPEDLEFAVLTAPASLFFETDVEKTDDEEWEIKTTIKATLPSTTVRWKSLVFLAGGKKKYEALLKSNIGY